MDRAVPDRLFADCDRLRRAPALIFDCALRHMNLGSITVNVRLSEPSPQRAPLTAFPALLTGLRGVCVSDTLPGMLGSLRIRIPLHALVVSRARLAAPATNCIADPDQRINDKSGSTSRGSVLLVDDDRLGRGLLSNLLGREGYRVTEADSGSDALNKLRYEIYGALIIDLLMPGISGLQLVKSIHDQQRHRPGATGIPYRIALTAGLGGEFASSDRKRLFNQCLLEPVGLARVVQALRAV